MNEKQKAYDSYDNTKYLLKLTESKYHTHNLHLIQNRKNIKATNNSIQYTLKHPGDPIKRFFKEINDKYIQFKLTKITKKQVKPTLNDSFILNEKKRKIIALNKNKDEQRIIEKQNQNLSMRLSQIHSFISVKDMDNSFNQEHSKMMKKLRKVENGRLLLPILTQTNVLTLRSIKSNVNDRNTKNSSSNTDIHN